MTQQPLFALTLFLSAALMFAVQPMVGKMLLPVAGGAPAGWIVALAFFQTALLAGYLLAHFLSRLSASMQASVYVAGMGAAALFLPVSLPEGVVIANPYDIFLLLARSVGVPFVFLSATSSTLQRLFASTPHPSAHDPYFLYAASNLGSLAGLFAYPLALEPLAGLKEQSALLFYMHVGIIALAVACLFHAKKPVPASSQTASGPDVKSPDRLKWALLAFLPSALLSGVTTHITTDVFSAPLLWALPLAVYIGTFVAAFARTDVFPLRGLQKLHLPAVALSLMLVFAFSTSLRMSFNAMLVHLAAFGITAMLCHKLLAAARPSKERLTEFYLVIAAGGALGGILNAFVIPATLDRLIEYPLFLTLSMFLNPAFKTQASRAALKLAAAGMACLAVLVVFSRSGGNILPDALRNGVALADGLLAGALLLSSLHPRTALAAGLAVVSVMEFIAPKNIVLAERNFFGVVKVFDLPLQLDGKLYEARYMYHGTTTHGFQVLDKTLETTPTTYFSRTGPAGHLFDVFNPRKVLVIGLGTGTLNCYKTPENDITFIELDPDVVKIAREYFTFLSACKTPRIIVGDGRLALSHLNEKFDLILVDAFSSDTIPTHLVTSEALGVYAARLAPGGIVAFNLSNRYINLWYTLIATAAAAGMESRFILDIELEEAYAAYSQWLAVSTDKNRLKSLETRGWVDIPPSGGLRPWTDDYTNLLSTLEF